MSISTDLHHAARSLRKVPAFTAAAILTLGLGIAATTTLFSVVYGVLLRSLPYPEADRIVQLFQVNEDGDTGNLSEPNFLDLRERTRSFEALALVSMTGTASVVGGSEPVRASWIRVTGDYFGALGVRPLAGRGFVAEEQTPGGRRAMLVSEPFWRNQLGATPDLGGTTLRLEGEVYSVVGVMPAGFGFPEATDLIIPREITPAQTQRTGHNWRAVGRLAEGVTLPAARLELDRIARELKLEYGEDTWMSSAAVVPIREQMVGSVRPALLVLLGAAAFLFLIAGANVANLLLTRSTGRRREIAVRLALGAGRRRLVQSAVAEAMILALAAAVLGVTVAVWGVDLLRGIAPANLPRADSIRVDGVVLASALGVSLLTALVLGIGMGSRGVEDGMREVLSERRSGGGSHSGMARSLLASGQMALTVVLLVGAVLLGRSFMRLLAVDPGYRTSGAAVLSVSQDWPTDDVATARLARFNDDLLERLAAIPGVQNVGGVNGLPFFSGFSSGSFLKLERPDEVADFDDFMALARIPERIGDAEYRVATDGYFAAIGIPLLRGRAFGRHDHPDAPHVALVSESLASTTWPGEDPIGKLVQFGNMDGDLRAFTVVGVVGDVRQGGLAGEVVPTFYSNARQRISGASSLEIVIHGSVRPARVFPTARAILREMAPEIPPRLRTLDDISAGTIAQRRFSLILFGVFGATALLLAIIGLYGVVSYTVAQRTHEIGIRTALGARPANVTGMVVRQGAVLATSGIVVGLLAALALTRLISGLLFGVAPTDPVAYAMVAMLLISVALLASYLPARRAARVDPMIALRNE